jgi:tRNA-dihydrouridine synthase B
MNFFSKLEGDAFLAPMADYTNIAFRNLAKENGASLLYTELVSVKSILFNSKKTLKLIDSNVFERPIFLQLFGNTPLDFSKSIRLIEKNYPDRFAGYDLNSGCSVTKAIKGKYGVKLMENPLLVKNILDSMHSACNKPISIKMRLGLNQENFLEVSQKAIDAKVNAICLHARLGNQGYSGLANWLKIKELKKNCSKTKIIANGDVKSIQDYINIKKETNCDFVMIGRGSIGNAFIFNQIKNYNLNSKIVVRDKQNIFSEGKRFLELIKEFKLGVNDARGYFLGLFSGFTGAKEFRTKIALAKNLDEIESAFNLFFE